jgi:hypothetical protein
MISNAKVLYKEMKRKKIDNSITELSILEDETSCAEACSAHTVDACAKFLQKFRKLNFMGYKVIRL